MSRGVFRQNDSSIYNQILVLKFDLAGSTTIAASTVYAAVAVVEDDATATTDFVLVSLPFQTEISNHANHQDQESRTFKTITLC